MPLTFHAAARFLVPLLQLKLAGTGHPPKVERQAKPITLRDMFRFLLPERLKYTLQKNLESLLMYSREIAVVQHFATRFESFLTQTLRLAEEVAAP